MSRGEGGGGLSRKLIELRGSHALVDSRGDLLRHEDLHTQAEIDRRKI